MERQIRKKIQLIATWIVTSLPFIASRESLYFETWWGKIYSRRKISRQKTMYEIDQNILCSYIMDISPNKSTSVSNFSSRNAQNYCLPKVVRNYTNLLCSYFCSWMECTFNGCPWKRFCSHFKRKKCMFLLKIQMYLLVELDLLFSYGIDI